MKPHVDGQRKVVTLDFQYAGAHATLFKLRCALADTAGVARPISSQSNLLDKREDKVGLSYPSSVD